MRWLPESYQTTRTGITFQSLDASANLKGRPWLPPLLWAGAMFVATSLPGSMLPRQIGPYDKVGHFFMYAVLAALLTLAASRRRVVARLVVLTVLAVSAYGAADEWHQQFIPGRSMEFRDWVADSLGGVTGVLVGSLFILRSKRSQA
jgi:VanZ family protein